jgi:hypothetical protein
MLDAIEPSGAVQSHAISVKRYPTKLTKNNSYQQGRHPGSKAEKVLGTGEGLRVGAWMERGFELRVLGAASSHTTPVS